MYEIIPGILEKDWSEIERKIELVKPFAKTIHVDIIDGKFFPNTTFLDPKPFAKYKDLFLELHMMVANPMQYLQPFSKVGFRRFIGHVESFKNPQEQEEFVAKAQSLGEVGLAIDGPTPISMISVPYKNLDCVLVMTIKAGESGQKFNLEYLKKVEVLSAKNDPSTRLAHSGLVIEVDGGINDQTIVQAKIAGVSRFVSTSFVFNAQNPQEQYNLLKERIH